MKNKKSKFFKTIPEVLKSDTSDSLKQIRSVSIENQYWSNIFKQAFDEMPHDFTELNKSILRISKLKSNMSGSYLPAILVPIVGIIFPAFAMALLFIYIEKNEIA